VKGAVPGGLAVGKVTVVEFWATWCAPCRDNFPRLSALAKKHAGKVVVAGVSVWESKHSGATRPDPLPAVQAFVRRQGKQMAYHVAVDRVDGIIARRWLEASGSRSIPTAFIVDARGRVAWIGNGYGLEDALSAVLARSGNPAKAVAAAKARQAAATMRLERAAQRGDLAAVLRIRKTLPDSVSLAPAFKLLERSSRTASVSFARTLMRDPAAGMWQFLDLAWVILDPGSGARPAADYRLAAELAQAAERRADASDESRLACLSYLVSAHEKGGDLPRAATAQERAIAIMEASKTKNYAAELKEARAKLEAYRRRGSVSSGACEGSLERLSARSKGSAMGARRSPKPEGA